MDSIQKENLDFDIAKGEDGEYTIRLRGSIFEGIEYRYTVLKFEEKPLKDNLYFDYEIVTNPNAIPVTGELHNFVSFITERLVRSGLIKATDEASRNRNFGKFTI